MEESKQLWHSAQQLRGSAPNIIYQGTIKLEPTKDEQERDKVLSAIDNVVLLSKKKLSKPSGVIIHYNPKYRNFVVKSIPIQRDSYDRISPILSYGRFPDEANSGNWIELAVKEIEYFASSINRTFSEKTLSDIKESLEEAKKKLEQEKRLSLFILILFLILVALLIPVFSGIILHNQIPQLLQAQLIQQTPQTATPQNLQVIPLQNLQQIIQKILIRIVILIAINNVLLLILLALPLAQILKQQNNRKTPQ